MGEQNQQFLKEDWGGDGRGRMNLSGRSTAISHEYIPRQYQFFDTNPVPEKDWKIMGMPTNVIPGRQKFLSWRDNFASSSKITLPPNFQAPAGIFTADLEIFILTGKIQLGEWKLRKHGYSFIPAGVKVGPWKVLGDQPVEILWMENGPVPLKYENAKSDHPEARIQEFIPPLDTQILPWGKTDTVQFLQANKKWIRKDNNGGGVWLITILPHYDGLYSMIQGYNEESYCLAGYCDIGEYRFATNHFGYVPSFSTVSRHRTYDGCLCFVRVDRDLSKLGTVLSYPDEI